MEAEAARKSLEQLTNYGALGLCLMLALVTIWFLDKDRSRIRDLLSKEQEKRRDDASQFLKLALELQEREAEKVTKLDAIAAVVKSRALGGGGRRDSDD